MSDSLWPQGLQHARLLCSPLSPGVCSDSCLLSQRCYLTISSSAAPFSFCLHFSPGLGSFPMNWLCIRWPKYWNFSFRNSLFNEYSDWFPLEVTSLISLQFKGLSIVFSSTTVWNDQFFCALPYGPTLTSVHDYWKNHDTYILLYKIDIQQGSTVLHRELCSTLCNDLNGKRIWKRIDTYIRITESLCWTPETLLTNYTPI